jgi:hypothetical protein
MKDKYERSRNPAIPEWWWRKARPLIASDEVRLSALATQASRYAQRRNPWGPDAITKFFNDEKPRGRTPLFANALSDALKIPRPFYIAPTENAALRMSRVEAEEAPASTDAAKRVAEKLADLDQLGDIERHAAIDQRGRVSSTDNETTRSGRPRRVARRSS